MFLVNSDIPTIQVKSHVTDIAGRAGIAFVLPETTQSANLVALPGDPQALLDNLNTYSTGCSDSAGYGDAVGVFANMLIGYANVGILPFIWYFSLADVPGVVAAGA